MSAKDLQSSSRTDWARLEGMNEEEIDYSDIPPLDASWFARARLRLSQEQLEVSMMVDADVLRWFQSQGENWQERMRAALRLYAAAHQTASVTHQ